jgi:hypothetical protein
LNKIYDEENELTSLISNNNRVCIVSLRNSQNVGNILVKFSLYKMISEFGFNITLIASKNDPGVNISFLNKTINLKVINGNFSELKEKDYDYILVNSDQTWGYPFLKEFYDVGFLKFAENWTTNKFIYGASIGKEKWFYNKKEEEIAIKLLKNFTGISFREKGLVKLAENHLGIKGVFVLDPTFLIDKIYYLNEIQNYTPYINMNIGENFIFVYQLDPNLIINNLINDLKIKFNYQIYNHRLGKSDYVESFIFGINNSKAVITDSYHGTIFSIIFNKPFISFVNRGRGKGRFDSLKEIFNIDNRFIDPVINKTPNINILFEPLNINYTLFNRLKNFSINYLKLNLNINK